MEADPARLRLGHISYSNCFPVHARLVDRPRAGDPVLLEGVPSQLNAMLAERRIDVAPSSSIEYALHADRYRILPDLVIGARGAVHSIVFLSKVPPGGLSGRTVAVPTASATSVVLLKILLKVRWGADAGFRWFDQSREDPFAGGADAALFIGDVALRKDLHPGVPHRFDLGLEWWEQTGLPFAFAVWQANRRDDERLRRLHALLVESRGYGERERALLADRYAEHFRMGPRALEAYWRSLVYVLDDEMIHGLETFYRYAAEVGELAEAPALRWVG